MSSIDMDTLKKIAETAERFDVRVDLHPLGLRLTKKGRVGALQRVAQRIVEWTLLTEARFPLRIVEVEMAPVLRLYESGE